jgi:hypothetical protein
MAKKRPFIAMLYMTAFFVLITLITLFSEGNPTGLFVQELNSLASTNSLVMIGPIVIFILLLSAGIIALRKLSKE